MRLTLRATVILVAAALLLVIVLGGPVRAASGDTLVQEFFVPLTEPAVLTFMDAIDETGSGDDPASPMTSFIGITIGTDGTQIHYDHHENGYVADLSLSPELIWGDGNCANGFPPRKNGVAISGANCTASPGTIDNLLAGDVIDLRDDVPVPLTGTNFDGRDRFGATKLVNVTRAMFATGTGAFLAGAVEVTDTRAWGSSFRMPVGETSIPGTSDDMFEEVRAFVMAGDDGASVQLNGGTAVALGPGGQTVFTDITVNDQITSDNPVQVHLLTGDVNDTYETRWYLIPPTSLWASNYYSPVGTVDKTTAGASGCTSVWLFNPGTNSLAISYTFGDGTNGSVTVPAGTSTHWATGQSTGGTIIKVPNGYGARYYTAGGELFYALATVDCDGEISGKSGDIYDWGFPLVPGDLLSSVVLVGQAPGCTDPDCGGSGQTSRSPVWISPLANTTVYWDYNGNAYSCADTDAIPAGNKAALTALQSITIVDDSDNQMTGAKIFTCDGTAIAAAWGQDPDESFSGDVQALDMGTVILPYSSQITIDKSVDQTLVKAGTEVTYTYLVENSGSLNLRNVSVVDDTCPNPTAVVKGNGNNVGDANDDAELNSFFAETWVFECKARIEEETTNVAFSKGLPVGLQDDPGNYIESDPDEETVYVSGAVGNYVWLDENSNGLQDAGEPGLPNIRVTLTGTDDQLNPVSLETTTDANGGYLFDNVPPGTYAVSVDLSTLPAGMTQTANPVLPGGDFGNQTAPYAVVVTGPSENLTADFGFNWNPTICVDDPADAACADSTATLGDRVWVDTNGDGVQDPNEIGVEGATVELYTAGPDGIFGTGDDALADSTTTDANGNYIFDGLTPGGYVVVVTQPSGYSPTGDPDQPGVPCTACDNQTTTPVVLGPGDVYLNADFGYQPAASGSIGDRVWLDANADGVQDGGEPGIPGVTVALIKDGNGNGQWDAGEPIIGTDTTDANGNYLFDGLPTGSAGDYLVWVNDTDNVLAELVPTFDKDGASPAAGQTTGLGISSQLDLAGAVTDHDFGYAPPSHDPGDGLIGDTIFLDLDGGNDFDPGEGIEGVTVNLYASDGTTLLATTTTDENGNYTFGNLPAGTYVVKVDTSTLPNGGTGLTNSIDPDGGTTNQSTVTIASGETNLLQDFGYVGSNPGSIGNLIWNDVNGDGDRVDPGEAALEPGLDGVTIDLYEDVNGDGEVDPGDRLVGSTVTSGGGAYQFNNLPPGDYLVDVTDENGVLAGFWHSQGTPGADNNSQTDPYAVTLSAGATDNTADFGYFVKPGAVGNFVWADVGAAAGGGVANNGFFDEPASAGINGVEVTLTITYPDGTPTVLKTVTANEPGTGNPGWYTFGNLLLDEDYIGDASGSDAGEPTFVLSIGTAPSSYPYDTFDGVADALGIDLGTDNNADPSIGEPAFPAQGGTDNTNDFGFSSSPSAVSLLNISGSSAQPEVIRWAIFLGFSVLLVGAGGYLLHLRKQPEGLSRW